MVFKHRLARSGDRRVADSLRGLEIDRYELRNSTLFHRHAKQPVHPGHRHPVMRDDQKAGVGLVGDFPQQITAPSIDITRHHPGARND